MRHQGRVMSKIIRSVTSDQLIDYIPHVSSLSSRKCPISNNLAVPGPQAALHTPKKVALGAECVYAA